MPIFSTLHWKQVLLTCWFLGLFTSSFAFRPLAAPTKASSLFLSSSEKLIPRDNPDLDPNQKSTGGVPYTQVLQGLNQLYPPQALEERNAASRTDGYWPYIQKGQDPPKQFTYGEFDFSFFGDLLDRYAPKGDDIVFCDIGSGAGRLVLAAAALHPDWRLCRGIEILPSISNVAQSKWETCREDNAMVKEVESEEEEEEWVENEHGLLVKAATITTPEEDTSPSDAEAESDPHSYSLPVGGENNRLPLAPVEFVCGSFEDPYLYFGDVDCVFCFSSCMSTSILQSLSHAIGRQCQPGAIVISTDFSLELEGYIPPHPDDATLPLGEYQLELLESVDGYCWLTGGHSTAYIHRVQKSLWDGSGPRIKPELPASEKAFRAIKAMEEGKNDSAVRFLSGVRNNMFFAGFPERWLPDPSNYKPDVEEDEEDYAS